MTDSQRERSEDTPEVPEAPPLIIQMPVDVRNLALTVIAVLGVTLVLQMMESVLIPIVLGILISYALSPIVKGLIAIVQRVWSGQRAADVLAFDMRAFLRRIGLESLVTVQRRIGLEKVIERVREQAKLLAK